MTTQRWNLFYGFFLVALAVAFLPKVLLADSALYTRILTPQVILYIGSPTKIFFLFLAVHFSRKTASSFGEGSPVRTPWRFMTAGFLGFFLGQCILAVYQIVLCQKTPFPSPADPFFLLGTLCLVVAFVQFILAYREAGYPVGTSRQLTLAFAVLGLVALAVGIGIILPLVEGHETRAGLALDSAYILLDLALLAPGLILLTTAVKLRGGALVKVWGFLMAGTLCLAAGDILGGFFAATQIGWLDPLLDLMFAWSYILCARGAQHQYELAR